MTDISAIGPLNVNIMHKHIQILKHTDELFAII